jgi:autotransporter-associated beta strand protein
MRASFLVLFLTIKASAQLTWSLAGGNENWPADKRTAIIAAMTEAVAIYNANGYFPKTLWANYNASVPTAQASYSGWIDFGGQISTRTAMHEISHTLGVGQYSTWSTRQSNGVWTGTFANNRVKLFDGPATTIGCDSMHFWPYGLNFANEDSTTNRIRHVKVVSALRRDMGIVTDSDGDGIPNDWEMFYFGNLTQTASGDADGDGVNNLNEYNADTNPAAAATQWNGSTSSDWSVATNWTPVIAPSNGTFYTRINVNNNGNHALVHSSSQGSTVFRPADRGLAIGSGANNANTTGTMNITGGTFSTVGAQSPDIIGNGQGNSGTLNIAGGSYASDDLHLGVTGQGTGTFNLNSGSASISALSFRFASGGTGTVNLNGGTLTTGSISRVGSGTGNIHFNGATLRASAPSVSFLEGLSNAVIKSGGLTVDTSTHDITIAQPLLNDTASPNGGLTKTGSGTLYLTGSSTYTGTVQITQGPLQISHTNALGASGAGVVVANSATLALSNNISTPAIESIFITGVGKDSRGALQSSSGNNTWAGPIFLEASNSRIGVQDGASLTLSGIITESSPGTALIFRAGNGTEDHITLNRTANNWTGATSIFSSNSSGGAVRLGTSDAIPKASLLQVAGPGVAGRLDLNGFHQSTAGLTHSTSGSSPIGDGVITNTGSAPSVLTLEIPQNTTREFIGAIQQGSGGIQLTKTGNGTQILSGTNTYAAGTSIAAGTLRQGTANAFGSTNSRLLLTGGAANLNGFPLGVGTLEGTGGSIVNNASSTEAQLTVGNGNASGSTFSGIIADRSTGTGILALTKVGTGTQTLAGNNSFSGPLLVSGGVLIAGSPTALGNNSGPLTIQSGAALRLAAGVTISGKSLTLNGAGAGFNGALQAAENSTSVWAGPIVIADANARIGAMPGGTLDVRGAITGNSSFQSISIGAGAGGTGTVILSAAQAANTYSGITAIVRGTLKLGTNHTLPATTTVDVDSANAAEDAIFDLNGYHQLVAGIQRSNAQGGTGNSWITNSHSSHSLLTIHPAGEIAYSGRISGNLSITKSNLGTLILSGANSYTGNTTISAGTLRIDSPFLHGSSSVAIAAGARLNLNFSGHDPVGGLILAGLAMPPGIYNSTTHGGFLSGSGSLVVSSNFDNWLNHFPQLTGEDRSPLADPDHDGFSNLIEYALCIPPDSAQPHPLDQSTGPPLTRFNRDPNRTDIIITVEASDHLTQWTPIARSTSGAPFASLVSNVTCSETPLNPSLMRVSISDTSSSANRRFLRISVTR